MQAQVIVKAAGAALLCPDDDQIGQRTGSRAGAVGRRGGGIWEGTGGSRVRRHGARGGLHCTRRVQAAIPVPGGLNACLCALGLAQQARAAAGRRRCGIHEVGRNLARSERITEARPARQDQPQAPAPELRVVAARELRLALPRRRHVLNARAGPPDLPDRERIGHQQHTLKGTFWARFSASRMAASSAPKARMIVVGRGTVSVWFMRRAIVLGMCGRIPSRGGAGT